MQGGGKGERGRSLGQDLQVLNVNPKLVTVTLLQLGKEVVGGWVCEEWQNQAGNQGLHMMNLSR